MNGLKKMGLFKKLLALENFCSIRGITPWTYAKVFDW